jgi:hypothetical protein
VAGACGSHYARGTWQGGRGAPRRAPRRPPAVPPLRSPPPVRGGDRRTAIHIAATTLPACDPGRPCALARWRPAAPFTACAAAMAGLLAALVGPLLLWIWLLARRPQPLRRPSSHRWHSASSAGGCPPAAQAGGLVPRKQWSISETPPAPAAAPPRAELAAAVPPPPLPSPAQAAELIRRRRSVYPRDYVPGVRVPDSSIQAMLEAANWAPSHGRTEPWRFVVLGPKGMRGLHAATEAATRRLLRDHPQRQQVRRRARTHGAGGRRREANTRARAWAIALLLEGPPILGGPGPAWPPTAPTTDGAPPSAGGA